MRRIAAVILACLIARQTPSSNAIHARTQNCDPLGLRLARWRGDGAPHSSTTTLHAATSSSSGWRRAGAAGGGACTRGRLTLRGGADASGGGVGEEMAFVEEIGDNSTLRVEVLLMLERTTRPPDSSLDRLKKKKRCTTGHATARIFPLSVHPGGYPGANLGSISNRCHPILVAFAWELTEETINLPLDCLQGGESRSECLHPVIYSSLIVCTSSIVVSIRSRSSFISSPVWTH